MANAVIKFLKINQIFQQLSISGTAGVNIIQTCKYAVDSKKQKEFQKEVDLWDKSIKKHEISKAMKAYLERAKTDDEFMKQQQIEYQIGKRHLANMMGEDPATFTQIHIDEAIRYLFPSGLYDPRARPMMKPPEKIFPARKAAAFDVTGRPFHFLFYTAKPNFFQIMFDVNTMMEELRNYEDSLIKKKIPIDYNTKINSIGYEWLSKDKFEQVIMESIVESEYANFIVTLERFMEMPYSQKYTSFVNKYRYSISSLSTTFKIPQPQVGEDGRLFITSKDCKRKRSVADVTIRSPGTGKFTVNGQDILYFTESLYREQVVFPLIFTNMVKQVDIECTVTGGGQGGQSGAIRFGIAWGLRSFVDAETIEDMRLAGLLTRDIRSRERKKPGQKGARAKHTWKKR